MAYLCPQSRRCKAVICGVISQERLRALAFRSSFRIVHKDGDCAQRQRIIGTPFCAVLEIRSCGVDGHRAPQVAVQGSHWRVGDRCVKFSKVCTLAHTHRVDAGGSERQGPMTVVMRPAKQARLCGSCGAGHQGLPRATPRCGLCLGPLVRGRTVYVLGADASRSRSGAAGLARGKAAARNGARYPLSLPVCSR